MIETRPPSHSSALGNGRQASRNLLLLLFRPAIKPAHIRLPHDGKQPYNHGPRLRLDVREGERGDQGPVQAAPRYALRHSASHPLDRRHGALALEQRVGGKEVDVEQRRVDELVHRHLCSRRERRRRVVEVPRQEHEPLVAGDRDHRSDDDGAYRPERVVVVAADQLGREVACEVDEGCDPELSEVRPVVLLVAVPVEEANRRPEIE